MATMKHKTIAALGAKTPKFSAALLQNFHHSDHALGDPNKELRELNQWLSSELCRLFGDTDSLVYRIELIHNVTFEQWFDRFSENVLWIIARSYGDGV
jgi:hypothetical protein